VTNEYEILAGTLVSLAAILGLLWRSAAKFSQVEQEVAYAHERITKVETRVAEAWQQQRRDLQTTEERHSRALEKIEEHVLRTEAKLDRLIEQHLAR